MQHFTLYFALLYKNYLLILHHNLKLFLIAKLIIIMETAKKYKTKRQIMRENRNDAIIAEFHTIMNKFPRASVMVVKQQIADKHNVSLSSISNIIANNGTNSAQR